MSTICKSLSRVAEQNLLHLKKGIVGVDEAGRGPLCGPVVCAAVYVPFSVNIEDMNVMDSKVTKEHEREATFEILTHHPAITWDVSIVSNVEIDKVNILQATLNGMRRAADSVLKKASAIKSGLKPSEMYILVDGNQFPSDMGAEGRTVIKGDSTMFSIAAASIIAKVTRDRLMLQLDKEYPAYNLAQHKGYPTFAHRTVLHKVGPCPIYRFSYRPVAEAARLHGYPLPSYIPGNEEPSEQKQTKKQKVAVAPKQTADVQELVVDSKRKRSVSRAVEPSATSALAVAAVEAKPIAARKKRSLSSTALPVTPAAAVAEPVVPVASRRKKSPTATVDAPAASDVDAVAEPPTRRRSATKAKTSDSEAAVEKTSRSSSRLKK